VERQSTLARFVPERDTQAALPQTIRRWSAFHDRPDVRILQRLVQRQPGAINDPVDVLVSAAERRGIAQNARREGADHQPVVEARSKTRRAGSAAAGS
jgi:hypothetical protein